MGDVSKGIGEECGLGKGRAKEERGEATPPISKQPLTHIPCAAADAAEQSGLGSSVHGHISTSKGKMAS